jgi:hypothetical protein
MQAAAHTMFRASCGNGAAASSSEIRSTSHTHLSRHLWCYKNTPSTMPKPSTAGRQRPVASRLNAVKFAAPAASPGPPCVGRKYRKTSVHQFTRGTLGLRQAHAEHFCTLPSWLLPPGTHTFARPPPGFSTHLQEGVRELTYEI